MDIQAFTQNAELCFKTGQHDFIYQSMLELTKGTSALIPFESLQSDFKIPHEELVVIVSHLTEKLKNYLAQLRSSPPLDMSKAMLSEVTILGQKTFLYPKFPLHGQLVRLHELFVGLAKAANAKLGLDIFVIPVFNSLQFRLVKALKKAPAGIAAADLPQILLREYARLSRLDVISDELKSSFENDVRELKNTAVLEANLAILKSWHLIRQMEPGRKILPTQKLLQIDL